MPPELDFSVLDPANAVLTLRGDLRFTPCEFDREACYMIEDPLRGKFFRIGSDEFALISLLDGKNTIAEAVGLSAKTLRERAFTENEAMAVCHWLLESQLAACGGAAQGERLVRHPLNWPYLLYYHARSFVCEPKLCQWSGEGGQLHWIGLWDGFLLLYNHLTLGLAWLCLCR